MSSRSIAIALLFCLISLGFRPADAFAQEAKHSAVTGSIAPRGDQGLDKKQVELVRKVNAYFNQLTTIKGTFLQTSADNQRQRGHYYISIQDHDLNTEDRWDLTYTPFRALLQREVDLLRDTRIFEVKEEQDGAITILFED